MDDLQLYEQFKDLSLRFPKLSLIKDGDGLWEMRGVLKFSAIYSGYQIDDEYSMQIIIPEQYSDVLPKVQEIGNRIPKDFHHYQNDDSLCLGAPLAVKQKFIKVPTLIGFVNNCLIPYLYSFSYKSKFGKMPFGELSHGWIGILEFYKELFDLKDNKRVLKLIEILAQDTYNGHDRCPCGTGKRLQACHGQVLLEIKNLQSPAHFRAEYDYIVTALVEIAIKRPYPSYIYQNLRT